ncbi:MAG: PilT/PilU family type 4a pilus ATPase [Candidatus Omnitrophica bacterium]|nr:PilT/PilU family type 4a pilus ATPase [Candidatus Omnitrophota bacterium]
MSIVEEILEQCIERQASDIHLAPFQPATYRVFGSLRPLNDQTLSEKDIHSIIEQITAPVHIEIYQRKNCAEFAYDYKNGERFRVSLFKQRGADSLVLRRIPGQIMPFEETGLPENIKQLIQKNHGLILVTGPTGSGKSTSLASMVNYINETDDRHIITIEDPIEFVHTRKKSLISQRELGADTPAFAQALTESLRQDPDTILVGEMRDLETIETALMATETGHMVFSTLHTFGAARTIDRIIDVFPTHQQNQVRLQISTNLLAVISQQLVPRIDREGRIAVFEIMILTPAIQNLIRKGQTYHITNEIQMGVKHGMISAQNQLIELYQKKIISKEDALFYSLDAEDLIRRLGS